MLEELELTFPQQRQVEGCAYDDEEEVLDSDMNVTAIEVRDEVDFALRESEIGSLLAHTCALTKSLTTKSRICAVRLYDALEVLLSDTLARVGTNWLEEDSWDVFAILRLFETSVAASALLHASPTHSTKFFQLSQNLLQFTNDATSSRAWQGKACMVNIVVACTSALGSFMSTMWGWTKLSPDMLLNVSAETFSHTHVLLARFRFRRFSVCTTNSLSLSLSLLLCFSAKHRIHREYHDSLRRLLGAT